MNSVVGEGRWSDTTRWVMVLDAVVPPIDGVHAVFGVIFKDNKVLLTKGPRGRWEATGGHLEVGESVEQALHREVMEEGGAVLKTWEVLGYLKIFNEGQKMNKRTGKAYGNPSYIAIYVGLVESDLVTPTDRETVEAGLFDIDTLAEEVRAQLMITEGVKRALELGWIASSEN